MEKYVIATIKSWNIENTKKLMLSFPDDEIHLVTQKDELTVDFLKKFNPRYVFFSLVKVVSKYVERFKPDTIFTHHHGNLNIDHRRTCEAVLTA